MSEQVSRGCLNKLQAAIDLDRLDTAMCCKSSERSFTQTLRMQFDRLLSALLFVFFSHGNKLRNIYVLYDEGFCNSFRCVTKAASPFSFRSAPTQNKSQSQKPET